MSDRNSALFAAYFRAWRDTVTLDDIPNFVNILAIMANDEVPASFWQNLPAQIQALQRRGIKVVRTVFLPALYQSNHRDTEITAPLTPFDATEQGCQQRAASIEREYLAGYGYDGLVIDVNNDITGENLTKAAGVFHALARTWGRNGTFLIFDHDIVMAQTHLLPLVAGDISYYFMDAYGMSEQERADRWSLAAQYVPVTKFVPGFSFPEERGPRWSDVSPTVDSSRAAQLARWQPAGPDGPRKAGVFAYAIDRDGKKEGDDSLERTHFTVSQHITTIMKA